VNQPEIAATVVHRNSNRMAIRHTYNGWRPVYNGEEGA
jgi:hypothetical protein